jgi:PhnB protein
MATINPYLNFSGNCEEAFKFYQSVFGGEFTAFMRFKETPSEAGLSASEGDKIMHVALPIGHGTVLMGSDRPEAMGPAAGGNNFYISIQPESEAEAAKIFKGLTAGGQVMMPLGRVFWGATFGMLTDKFGFQWMVNYDDPQQNQGEEMQPQFVDKPAFTVVGMLIHTRPMAQEIPALWGQFAPRMEEVQYMAEPHVSYGLMDNFDSALGKLDYMAGIAVKKVGALPARMTRWDAPANTYAVFETTLPTIGHTFDYIYNTWLPTSDYQQAPGPYFERYGATFNPGDPTSKLSIYIPVKKKA